MTLRLKTRKKTFWVFLENINRHRSKGFEKTLDTRKNEHWNQGAKKTRDQKYSLWFLDNSNASFLNNGIKTVLQVFQFFFSIRQLLVELEFRLTIGRNYTL